MHKLTIAGLGVAAGQMTFSAVEALSGGASVLLKTRRMPAAKWLNERGIGYETLDGAYEAAEDFDQLNVRIAGEVLSRLERGDLVLGVMDLRDACVSAIRERVTGAVELILGVPVEDALLALAEPQTVILSASDWSEYHPEAGLSALIREIDDKQLASEVKLKLMERYPALHEIVILVDGETPSIQPLEELDRLAHYDHRVCAFIPAVQDLKALDAFGLREFERIIHQLRAPDGCPWDREQTHDSLKDSVIEEAYEVVDAIERGDMDDLLEELGDLLLQIFMHAEIAKEHGEFLLDDVTTAVSRKMIARHPHVFGTSRAETAKDVSALWEEVKKEEKSFLTQAESMRAVIRSLPALTYAKKIQKKAAHVGFDWDEPKAALSKVFEEAEEVKRALDGDGDIEMELGDLLYAAVNVARLAGVSGEQALKRSTEKFISRFERMESLILKDGKKPENMTLIQMDVYWERIKNEKPCKI